MPEEYLAARGIPKTNVEGSLSSFFPRVMPDVPLDYVKLAFQDLYDYGFNTTDKSAFHTMTMSSGFDLLQGRVTPIGRKFISFIPLH